MNLPNEHHAPPKLELMKPGKDEPVRRDEAAHSHLRQGHLDSLRPLEGLSLTEAMETDRLDSVRRERPRDCRQGEELCDLILQLPKNSLENNFLLLKVYFMKFYLKLN